jgi:hypothetical protein
MSWKGFSVEVLTNLQNCTKREVHLAVKGQMTNLVLKPSWPQSPQWTGPPSSAPADLFTPTQFCLVPTLQNSGLLRLSSDLSHVKVTRHDPKTGESWERVFDCSASSAPALWLRDGDIIEVPDKP